MSMPEGDDAKGLAESVSSPALFQASAPGALPGERPGASPDIADGARGVRRIVVAVALVGGVGALVGLRALVKSPPGHDEGSRQNPARAGELSSSSSPPIPAVVADGAMVDVPGGTFQMGGADGDPDEQPATAVTVVAFAMDTTEVTVAAFARCVSAGKCTEPDTGMYCNWRKEGHEGHPVNCVDLEQATSYCGFTGKRLPTEEEWEYAARGPEGRRYPWRDGAPGAQLCWNGEGTDTGKGQRQGTCPVASYPAGASPFGAFDMAGNVWEWTASGHCPYTRRGCTTPARVIRGGAWNNVLPQYVRAQRRSEEVAASRRDNVGFRCARNP
jgi:formylglycine-generating enzyme